MPDTLQSERGDSAQMAELANRVQRLACSLEDLKRKNARLSASVQLHQQLAETCPDGCLVLDDRARVTFANSRVGETLGYPVQELTGRSMLSLISRAQARQFRQLLQRPAADAGVWKECTVVRKDATEARVRLSAAAVLAADGRYAGHVVRVRDIDSSPDAAPPQRGAPGFPQSTLDGLTASIALLDERGRILQVNRAWREFAEENGLASSTVSEGVDYLRICDQAAWDGDEAAGKFAEGIRGVLSGELDSFGMEYPCHSSEEHRWFIGTVTRFPAADRRHVAVTHENITERRLAEAALRESEVKFRALFEQAPHSILLIDVATGEILDFNKHAYESLGYTREEFGRLRIEDCETVESPEAVAAHVRRVVERGRGIFETRHRTKDGRVLDRLVNARVISLEGRPLLASLWTDVTELKRTEEQLRTFQTISDQASYGAAFSDLEGSLLYVNRTFAEMHGYEPQELIGRNLSIFHSKEQLARVNALNDRLRKEGSFKAEEVWHTRRDGSAFPAMMNATIITDESGAPAYMSATAVDISDRKRDQALIARQAERFELLASATQDSICDIDLVTGHIWRNEAYQRTFGAPGEGSIPDNWWQDRLHPEDRERVLALEEGLLYGDASHLACDYRLKRPDGSYAYVNQRLYVVRGEDGRPVRMVGSLDDITDQKRAEHALRESEQRFRTLVDSAPVSILMKRNGKYVYGNRAAARMLGFERPDDLIGVDALSTVAPEFRDLIRARTERVDTGRSNPPAEVQVIKPDGERVWTLSTSVPVTMGGEPTAVIVDQDISERKRAEEQRSESEQKYRLVLENMMNGFALHEIVLDEDGGPVDYVFAEVNSAFETMTGLSREEVLGRKLTEVLPQEPQELRFWIEEYGRVAATGEPSRFERFVEGINKWFSIMAFSPREGQFATIFEDITERKHVEEELRRSEELLREVGRLARIGGWEHDLVTGTARWTRTTYDLVEIEPGSPIPGPADYLSYYPPEGRALLEHAYQHSVNTGERFDLELPSITAKGRTFWARIIGTPVTEDGRCVKMRGTFQDITDRKHAEEALRKSSLIIESASDGVITTDAKGVITSWNRGAERMYGYNASETLGRSVSMLYRPEDRHMLQSLIADLLERNDIPSVELTCVDKAGNDVDLLLSLTTLRDHEGNITELVGITKDITERKRTEEELREANTRQMEAVKGGNVGLWDWDLAADKVRYSTVWKQQIGYEDHEIGDDSEEFWSRVHPDDVGVVKMRVDAAIADARQDHKVEFRLRHKNGSYRWILAHGSIVRDGDGKPLRMRGSHVDITDRRQAEEDLIERERYFRLLMESMHEQVLVIDRDYRVTDANGAFLAACGENRSGVVGRRCHELSYRNSQPCGSREELCPLQEVFDTGEPRSYVHRHVLSDGARRWVDVLLSPLRDMNGTVTHVIEAARDVTDVKEAEEERLKLERQLREAQKMEAIGELAGGVAHDFNNLLTAMYGNVELLEAILPRASEAHRYLRGIREAAGQATGVTRALLTFSNRMPTQKAVTDVQQAVDGALQLIRRLLPAMIEVRSEPVEEGSLFAILDQTQFQQVVINLAVNSRDAMPDGGRLTVSVSHQDRPPAELQPALQCPHGVAVVKVTDTGMGISPSVQERVFEPFFTTKPRGSGTGLGLAIVHGVVEEHEGCVHVRSEPGKGSTFTVVLPAVSLEEALPAQPDVPASAPRGRGQTLILAEDDRYVREVIAAYLGKLNYAVVQAADGLELVDCYKKHRDAALLLVDFEMPKLNGLLALDEIRQAGGTTPAMLVTAHVSTDLESRLDRHTTLCRKPIELAHLARQIGEALQAKQNPETAR